MKPNFFRRWRAALRGKSDGGEQHLPKSRSRRGIALVLVLAFLVLITVFVIAFFSSVTTENSDASSYASQSNAKQLADTTVSVVTGAIRAATSGVSSDGAVVAWASQPGMIRTYDDKGNPVADYKLYSSDNMVLNFQGPNAQSQPYIPEDDANTSVTDPEITQNWASEPALFTDLNSPIADGTDVVYPIIDGHNLKQPPQPNVFYDGQPVTDVTYVTGTGPDIQGFGVVTQDTTGGKIGQVISGKSVALGNGSSGPNPVPMPVKWIYVLKNGGLISPDVTSGTIATFANTPAAQQPTQANPIVGRIAFWTDDETCKVNVNTASEGIYWDEPYTSSSTDVNYAAGVPIAGEFQRTPGHPATTCLSPVLGSLLPRPASVSPGNYNQLGQYYLMNPRTNNGGTDGGTAVATSGGTNNILPINLQNNRLYATADEIMFQPGISGTGSRLIDAPTSTISGGASSNQLRASLLQETKFFLTAQSRAPDLNLFGLPRVSLWPLQQQANLRNPEDGLIAFCTTTGTEITTSGTGWPYYFQRGQCYATGQNGTNNPVSGIPTSQSGTSDWSAPSMARNVTLFQYLQKLTATPMPGFGGTFGAASTGKYSRSMGNGVSEMNQILVEMMDYIRTAINTHNERGGGANNTTYDWAISNKYDGQNSVAPLVITPPGTSGTGTARGMGAEYTVSEANITFVGDSSTSMRAAFSVGLFTPWAQPPGMTPLMAMVVTGLNTFSVNNGQSLQMPTSGTNVFGTQHYNVQQTFAGNEEFMVPVNTSQGQAQSSGAAKSWGTTDPINSYPFFSQKEVPMSSSSPTFSFSGGTITIYLYPGYVYPIAGSPLQTIQITFPAASFPNPKSGGTALTSRSTGNTDKSFIDVNNDVSRSMQIDPNGPSHGDLRLVAGLNFVPASFFTTSQVMGASGYQNPSAMIVNSLRTRDYPLTSQSIIQTSNSPILVKGLLPVGAPGTGGNPANPPTVDAPVGLTYASMGGPNSGLAGDWDNGPGNHADGPLINRIGWGNNANPSSYYDGGFFGGSGNNASGTEFSANRQVASAIVFGDLPTGIDQPAANQLIDNNEEPWQSLLFCPNPAATGLNPANNSLTGGHPGFGTTSSGMNMPPYNKPPDDLLLDLFTMPVVEPYAISEPFSTAGKINMNYQIVPFTYIVRNTGIDAVMKAVDVTAEATNLTLYKFDITPKTGSGIANITNQTRFDIDVDNDAGCTLTGFQQRFDQNDIFRSPSEICGIYLVPNKSEVQAAGDSTASLAYTTMNSWWNSYQLTGKNAREAPYAAIYPRLTTKSNDYRVHYRVQVLKQVAAGRGNWATWNEGQDQILGEYRGSTLIERYIDPADPNLSNPNVDFATQFISNGPQAGNNLDAFYKFRILDERKF